MKYDSQFFVVFAKMYLIAVSYYSTVLFLEMNT